MRCANSASVHTWYGMTVVLAGQLKACTYTSSAPEHYINKINVHNIELLHYIHILQPED